MSFFCILFGYSCGSFLTVEIIIRHKMGKRAFEVGSKNPGTANVVDLLGLRLGIVTLLGDIFKTVLPCVVCQYLFPSSLGRLAILYAGIGAALGHGFPFWNNLRGCKMIVGKKYRGSFEQCLKRYVQDRLNDYEDIDSSRVFITHPMCSKQTVDMVKELLYRYDRFDEIFETPAGCTVSSHCGPNTLGILYIRKNKKAGYRT